MVKRNLHFSGRHRGFTLVELSIVITVIGFLAAIGMMSYLFVQAQSRDSKRQSDMTSLQNELEKFFDNNGVYPPGCPDPTCTTWFLTENTASPILKPTSSLSSIQAILPGIPDTFGDPRANNNTQVLMNRSAPPNEYYYYGGTIDSRATSSSAGYAMTTYFPCTITSSLSPGQTGSYVVGYYSESTKQWVLNGGKHGVQMTISGNVSDGCVINT